MTAAIGTTTSSVMKSDSATRRGRPNDSTPFQNSAPGSQPLLVHEPADQLSGLVSVARDHVRAKAEIGDFGHKANYRLPTSRGSGSVVAGATILGARDSAEPIRPPRRERAGCLAAQPDSDGFHAGLPHHPGSPRGCASAADGRDGGAWPPSPRSGGRGA